MKHKTAERKRLANLLLLAIVAYEEAERASHRSYRRWQSARISGRLDVSVAREREWSCNVQLENRARREQARARRAYLRDVLGRGR